MPFNPPLKRVRDASRPPSPPSRNDSQCSSRTTSSTSSLEAAPMRPPSNLSRGNGASRPVTPDVGPIPGSVGGGFAPTLVSPADLQNGTATATRRKHIFGEGPSSTSSSSSRARTRNGSSSSGIRPVSTSTVGGGATRDDLQSGSPVTPRGVHAPLLHVGAAAAAPIPTHLLPLELRPSASGPDLASLRQSRARAAASSSSSGSGRPRSGETQGRDRLSAREPRNPKARTQSSPADVHPSLPRAAAAAAAVASEAVDGTSNRNNSSGAGTSSPRHASPRAATLQDFIFGEIIGHGSFSTVVLAQHRATNLPYAIKILNQHQLVQERKTKYAKVERDALVLLGPRKATTATPGRGSPAAGGGAYTGDFARKRDSGASQRTIQGGPSPDSGASQQQQAHNLPQPTGLDKPRRQSQGHVTTTPPPPTIRMRRATEDVQVDKENGDGVDDDESGDDSVGELASSTQSLSLRLRIDTNVSNGLHSSPLRPSSAGGATLSPVSATSSMGSSLSSLRATSTHRPRLSHPGIVKLHYTFKDETSLYFVLDLAINGELLGLIRKHGSLDLTSARTYAAQILDALSFIHERGVIHRDLKPENVLLDDDMRVKLTDFGSAKIVNNNAAYDEEGAAEGQRKRSFVGTAEYVSPEVLRNEHAGTPSDLWAFGCIVFQMIAGRPPFRGATEYLTFQKVLARECEFPEAFDETAKKLCEGVWKLDPAERLTIEQVKAHAFFNGIDWDRLWTDQQPEIKTGIVAPQPPPISTDVSRDRWNDLFGTPVDDDASFGADHDDDERDELKTPQRQWIEHGGGAGTISSESVTTTNDGGDVDKAEESTAVDVVVGGGGGSTSLSYLRPNERIIYSSPILTRSRLTMPKRRTLVLTDQGRMICVSKDSVKDEVKVKVDLLLRAKPGSNLPVIREVITKGSRAFVCKMDDGGKEHTFIADREDVRARWMQEIASMR